MIRYILKRVLIGILVVFLVTILLFLFMQLLPGDPISIMTGGGRVTPEKKEEIRVKWGLDKPIYLQYFYWLSHVMVGDLGVSYVTKLPVSLLVFSRIKPTLQLTLTSLILSFLMGIPLGMVAALKGGGKIDHVLTGIITFFYSVPTYWLGLMLMLIFGLYLKMLPISGGFTVQSLILPVVTLTLPSVATFARLMRTETLETLREDFVRTAWAKGLPVKRIIFVHVLRNSIIPVMTMFFLYLPWVISGAVIVEAVFAYPGMGQLFFHSVLRQDYSVIQSIILIIAVFTVVSTILADILTAFLDPRIRIRGKEK